MGNEYTEIYNKTINAFPIENHDIYYTQSRNEFYRKGKEFPTLNLKEEKKKLPNEKIIYLGDTKRFPYGSKSKETIIELTKRGIEFFIKKDVKAIIIACGTATSQAIDTVSKMYNIPIIGIIEPTVNYILKQKNIKNIGVIATAGTIRSNGWEKALKEKNSELNIINKACPLLAPMAEEGWTNNEIERLEEAFLNYTFDLKVYGDKQDSNLYKFAIACFFSKL